MILKVANSQLRHKTAALFITDLYKYITIAN